MDAAIAAGHPATADAGAWALERGGSAADAAVAAVAVSCVAETVMTGLLGGGHAIYWDASARAAANLDCFKTENFTFTGSRDMNAARTSIGR